MLDSLSRYHHLSTSVLTNLLSSIISHQLPPDFNIAPLPSVIDLWLCSLLVKMPVNKARQVRPKMSTLAAGADGYNSSTALSSRMTPTSSPSPNHGNAKPSYQPYPKPSVKPVSLHQLSLPWLKEDFALPWFGDGDKVGVILELEAVKELETSAPAASVLILGQTCHALFTGIFASR